MAGGSRSPAVCPNPGGGRFPAGARQLRHVWLPRYLRRYDEVRWEQEKPLRSRCAPYSAMALACPKGPTASSLGQGNADRQPVITAVRFAPLAPSARRPSYSDCRVEGSTSYPPCPRVSGMPRRHTGGAPEEVWTLWGSRLSAGRTVGRRHLFSTAAWTVGCRLKTRLRQKMRRLPLRWRVTVTSERAGTRPWRVPRDQRFGKGGRFRKEKGFESRLRSRRELHDRRVHHHFSTGMAPERRRVSPRRRVLR